MAGKSWRREWKQIQRRWRAERQASDKQAAERRAAWWEKERRRIQLQGKEGIRDRSVEVIVKPNGRVFIDVYSTTMNQFSIVDGPPVTLSSLDDARALGLAVLEAMSRSNRMFLPARNLRTQPLGGELLEWRKAKSWAEYRRHARTVSLSATCAEAPTLIMARPWHNRGRGISVPIPDARFSIDYESPEQLGRAVQEAMAKATTV